MYGNRKVSQPSVAKPAGTSTQGTDNLVDDTTTSKTLLGTDNMTDAPSNVKLNFAKT